MDKTDYTPKPIYAENLPKTDCFNPDDFKGTKIRIGVIVRKLTDKEIKDLDKL